MLEALDRFGIDTFYGSQSVVLDNFALNVTNAWIWVPMYIALLILIIKNHDNMQQITICFVCGVVGVLLATGLTSIVTKPLFARLRPCNDPMYKYLVDIAGNLRNSDYSFFSSHSATSMSLAMFFALMVRDKLLSLSLFLWSLTLAWSRLYLGQHFLTDVLTGFAWGLFVGLMMHLVYRRFVHKVFNGSNAISIKFTNTGFEIKDIIRVSAVIVFTMLFALTCPPFIVKS